MKQYKKYKTMRTTDTHYYFWGGFCSQWAPSRFEEDGIQFNCTEQYMMYHKAKFFGDEEIAAKILETKSPRDQKALGRKVRNFDANKWMKVCEEIVTQGNRLKFGQNEDFKQELLNTENRIIVEASPEDKIWGIGLAPQDDRVLDESNWDGLNLLGKCIMTVREEIKEQV